MPSRIGSSQRPLYQFYEDRRDSPHPFSFAWNQTSVDDFFTYDELMDKVRAEIPRFLRRYGKMQVLEDNPGMDDARAQTLMENAWDRELHIELSEAEKHHYSSLLSDIVEDVEWYAKIGQSDLVKPMLRSIYERLESVPWSALIHAAHTLEVGAELQTQEGPSQPENSATDKDTSDRQDTGGNVSPSGLGPENLRDEDFELADFENIEADDADDPDYHEPDDDDDNDSFGVPITRQPAASMADRRTTGSNEYDPENPLASPHGSVAENMSERPFVAPSGIAAAVLPKKVTWSDSPLTLFYIPEEELLLDRWFCGMTLDELVDFTKNDLAYDERWPGELAKALESFLKHRHVWWGPFAAESRGRCHVALPDDL